MQVVERGIKMIRKVVGIHFSPAGVAAGMTDRLAKQLSEILNSCSAETVTTETYELLELNDESVVLDDEAVAVIGMPVYVGKVPLPAISALENIRANGTMAVVVVSYGARTYGNALYELQHYAEELGFRIIGAGAFTARYRRHGAGSSGYQYTGDRESLEQFGKAAAAKIARLGGSEIKSLRVKPAPLEVAGRLPIHRISRISPKAAAAAQGILERLAVRRRASEWFL